MLTIQENKKWQGRLGCCMVVSVIVVGWQLGLFFWFFMAALERNRKLYIRQHLLVVTVGRQPAVMCAICWESNRLVVAKLPCMHTLHHTCLRKWTLAQQTQKGALSSGLLPCTCPMCRRLCYVDARRNAQFISLSLT